MKTQYVESRQLVKPQYMVFFGQKETLAGDKPTRAKQKKGGTQCGTQN